MCGSARYLLLSVALFTLAGRLSGQTGATGSILGTVIDNSGAVLANATVEVANVDTGSVQKTKTNGAGDYNLPYLTPGHYRVTVQAPGFSRSVTDVITLAVAQVARVNVELKLGAVTETVEVTSSQVSLDTDTAGFSSLISQNQVEDLPLNGRNFMQLLLVGAGTVTVGGEQGTMRQGEGNAVSINGGRPESNNYTLDGLINTDTSLVTPAVILSQDAIQEFKMQSGNYSAEFGFSANQINLVSKSGGNIVHGSLFEFDRNDAFDAKPFPTATDFASGLPTANPVLRQNQFGFVASGPVVLPKIYNGRNKTFWMINYEGWRIKNGALLRNSVPNPATLQGNFSAEPLPAYGTADCTTRLSEGLDCLPIDPTTGRPFPGNVIPANRITSRFAQTALANGYFAAPNIGPPNVLEGTINHVASYINPLTTNQQTYRLDQNLGRLGQIFGRGTYSTFQNTTLSTSNLNIGYLTQFETQKNWEVSHTINLGKNNVNNFRFGYLNAQAPQGGPAPPSTVASAFGESGVFTKFAALQLTWPSLSIGPFGGLGGPVNAYTGSQQIAWEFADSFTSIRGKHTISAGVDYRRWRLIRNLDDDFLGDWSYSGSTVLTNGTNCATATCGTGNATADFLLGYYNNAATFLPGPLSPTNQAGNPQTHIFGYFGPYIEDDWKTTERLTLNMGLRWDYRPSAYEQNNHFFWRDVNNPRGGLCFADKSLLTNGVAPAGNGVYEYCGSNVPHPGPKTPFAPRLGFAYRMPGDKTVVRGGYGIFWDSFEGREIDDSGDLYPYSIRVSLTPTQQPTAPKTSNDLFPSFTTLAPISPTSLSTFIAVIESENPQNPYLQEWSLSVERELARNTTLEVNYIGNKSTHLLDRRNIAQPNSIPAADLPFCQANPQDTAHDCPTSSRLPYPNFTGYYIDSDWNGYANYNAMNVKLERRTSQMAVTAVFTWAKSMDDKSAAAGVGATGSGYQGFQNNHNPTADYGPSDFDVDHRFVASYVYQLPVGRGKRFLNTSNRVIDAAIGGWELTGITTFQTGFPYSIGASDASGLLDTQFQRASYVPGCNIHANLTQPFQRLNTACFTQPAAGVYGDTKRDYLRQPGINNFDIGLAKSFAITERIHFTFRADTFNTFNHHQYDVNVGGLATSGSGGGSSIDNGLGDRYFGLLTSSAPARIMQLGGKITF